MPAVGIDFGSSMTRVVTGGGCKVTSHYEFSSAAALGPDREPVIGDDVARQAMFHPGMLIASSLRDALFNTGEIGLPEPWQADDLAMRILDHARRGASACRGGSLPDRAVLTVPPCLTFAQRENLKSLAEDAGWTVGRIVNETSAAALAYSAIAGGDELVLVIDIGAGSTSVALCDIMVDSQQGTPLNLCASVAVGSATTLGAEGWRERAIDLVLDRIGIPDTAAGDLLLSRRVRAVAETLMWDLSAATSAEVSSPDMPPTRLMTKVTRAEFQAVTEDLVLRFRRLVSEVLCRASRPDKVLLLGGGMRIPALGQTVAELLPDVPTRRLGSETVARGAMLQAGVLSGETTGTLLLDSLGHAFQIVDRSGARFDVMDGDVIFPTRRTVFLRTSDDEADEIDVTLMDVGGTQESLLTQVRVGDLRSLSRRGPQVVVDIAVDANGVPHVDVSRWAPREADESEEWDVLPADDRVGSTSVEVILPVSRDG